MFARSAERSHIAPGAPVAAVVAALFVDENAGDTPGLAIPRAEVHLVARFGPSARGGLDIHAMGVRERVHRKRLRGGQWSVTARLRLGAAEAVLGARASAIAGRVVALDDLWGQLATRRLINRLGDARTAGEAAANLERAIGDRLASADRGPTPLVTEAARRLTTASVAAVAADLRVSERHLRRLFHDTVGVSPKTFARLVRFRRALRAARRRDRAGWASIATEVGYYDQAHLIADFRMIAGATPPQLLDELASALAVGC